MSARPCPLCESTEHLLAYLLAHTITSDGGADFRLAGASTVLCLVFPRFVDNVRRQGATYEVLERLHFFAEMNQIRTAFRWIYSVCFVSASLAASDIADAQLTLSIDGLTDAMKVNMSGFWSDMLYLSGHLSIFGACPSALVRSAPAPAP